MKVIITSVDAVYDIKNDVSYKGVYEALDEFINQNEDNIVIVVSMHRERLTSIPTRFNPLNIKPEFRRNGFITELRKIEPRCTLSDVLVLGAKKDDLILAAQERVPLLTAKYTNLPESVVGSLHDYGIPINSTQALKEYLTNFLRITNPWYYTLKVSDKTTLYSLTNAQTYYQSNDTVALNNHFQACLKQGNTQYKELFKAYFLMSCYSDQIINELKNIDYWGIYPSSGITLNQDLDYFKEIVRTSFNGLPRNVKSLDDEDRQLLIRTQPVPKRHYTSGPQRITNGCTDQLKTIILNPRYANKINGKRMCIIDDFSRFGTSCETTRIILEEAGASEIIFLTMGKFGRDYYKYNYQIKGNILSNFTAMKLGNPIPIDHLGLYNSDSNATFLNSLQRLL